MEHARGEAKRMPAPWDFDIAHKSAEGELMLQGLPYIDGFCLVPRKWRTIHDPSHQVPPTRTQNESPVRIDAFDAQTLSAVMQVREQVQAFFDDMQTYW